MDLFTLDSQKTRFNLSNFSHELGLSVTTVRYHHLRVMKEIFKGLWHKMSIPYNDLFIRLRGRKKVPKRLLVFDPGKTTGWALFKDGNYADSGQLSECWNEQEEVDAKLLNCFIEEMDPDFVLYEDYRIYSHKLDRHSYSKVPTLRVIGSIETVCDLRDIPFHKQMAVTAKAFCTDTKLKDWGLMKIGNKHAMDAIRHACYFLLFYKIGEDIVRT
jgi:hypothetical protein